MGVGTSFALGPRRPRQRWRRGLLHVWIIEGPIAWARGRPSLWDHHGPCCPGMGPCLSLGPRRSQPHWRVNLPRVWIIEAPVTWAGGVLRFGTAEATTAFAKGFLRCRTTAPPTASVPKPLLLLDRRQSVPHERGRLIQFVATMAPTALVQAPHTGLGTLPPLFHGGEAFFRFRTTEVPVA